MAPMDAYKYAYDSPTRVGTKYTYKESVPTLAYQFYNQIVESEWTGGSKYLNCLHCTF